MRKSGAEDARDGVCDDHVARRALRLGAGGDVRGFSDRLEASAAQATYDHSSAVDADPHLEIESGRVSDLADRHQNIYRATDRT